MRNLTITLNSDWTGALRTAASAAKANSYQGENLNFESANVFFRKLTESRWAMIHALQSDGGDVGVKELGRRLGRDPSRINHDASVLIELGLIEKSDNGGLRCPFKDIHVEMHLGARVS
jgi:predicted transcriptional regulator